MEKQESVKAVALISFLSIACTIFGFAVVMESNVGAASCKQITAAFARGSDQDIDADEYREFSHKLEEYFPDSELSVFELGADKTSKYIYPAVSVTDDLGVAIRAKISSGQAFEYGDSVKTGVKEIVNDLQQTHRNCRDTYYILGGYSQGAQVIGQALPSLPRVIRDKIVFVGLFGDPKLYLPEGIGFNPSACNDLDYSSWRRGNIDCDVNQGSLGSRIPYLPGDMKEKVGTWCYDHDYVCGSAWWPYDITGHGKYKYKDAAVDQAVIEAADDIAVVLPELSDRIAEVYADDALMKHDYVYMIDPGDLSEFQLDNLKKEIGSVAGYKVAQGANVALVESYMPTTNSSGYKILSDLQGGIINFQQVLDNVGTIDDTEIDGSYQVGTGIINTIRDIDWTPGSSREIVYYTGGEVWRDWNNTDYDRDELTDHVVSLAHQVGDVRISAVASEIDEMSDLREYAYTTNGDFFDNTPWIRPTFTHSILLASTEPVNTGTGDPILDQMIENDRHRPDIRFEIDAMYASPGQELNFDVSRSAAEYPKLARYEWDFDLDGTVDRVTTTPSTTYTYDDVFDGRAKVQAYTDDEYSDVATIAVHISDRKAPAVPQSPTNLKIDVLSTMDNKSNINLSWKLPSQLPYKYVLRVNDYPMGTLTSDRTSVEITDLDRSEDVTISLVGIDQDWNEGEPSTLVLPKSNGMEVAVTPNNATNILAVSDADKPNGTVYTNKNFIPHNYANDLNMKSDTERMVFLGLVLGAVVIFVCTTAAVHIIHRKRKIGLENNIRPSADHDND